MLTFEWVVPGIMVAFGWHIHSIPIYDTLNHPWEPDPADLRNLSFNEVVDRLAATGGSALRMDTNWAVLQPNAPTTGFNASSATLNASDYADYLSERGEMLWGGTPGFYWHFEPMSHAASANVKVVYNFGVIPDWARAAPPQGVVHGLEAPADSTMVGQYLADLIVYLGRQGQAGIDALKGVQAWQIFNEIGSIYGGPNDFLAIEQSQDGRPHNDYWVSVPLRPYNEYFATLENTMSFVNQALVAIEWANASGGAANPAVAGPTLAGVYNPAFWQALFDYEPVLGDPTLLNTVGNLKVESATLHPYGARVDAWQNPETPFDPNTPSPNTDTTVRSNLTYGRVLMPTDDLWTWNTLLPRDDVEGQHSYKLFSYASAGNDVGDAYFARNTEVGMERTMALLNGQGYGNIAINMTEWGGSSYRGSATPDEWHSSLFGTAFADPFKYGYIPSNQMLSQAMAENLQAEAIVQSLGLFEGWDFVGSATSYELFDQDNSTYEGQFGLAYGVNTDGTIHFKVSGLAYNAYMAGNAYNGKDLSGNGDNIGVNIHIQALGMSGVFATSVRETATGLNSLIHELVLLRDGDDIFNGLAGDDTIFGGSGADTVTGGSGYDRLYGGSGNDTINGGAQDDRIKGEAGDDILTGGTGKDAFVFSAYGMAGSGNAGQDTITDFEIGQDCIIITGGYGTATLLHSVLHPDYVVDVAGGVKIFYADNGASITVLGLGLSKATLTDDMFVHYEIDESVDFSAPAAGVAVNGTINADNLVGTANSETISGLDGADTLYGYGGNDVLDGGTGADKLYGNIGNDVYVVNSVADRIFELAGEGTDTVMASVSVLALADNVENLTLTGNTAINGTGNGLDNTVKGNSGNNTLSGGEGTDTLAGGTGNDCYVVDTTTDVIIELANGGTDLVKSSATLDGLADNIENLTLTGVASVNGTGNVLDNVLTGNSANNTLSGAGGNDTLQGGAGIDTLLGGDGDDFYIVDTTTDNIIETVAGGTDTVLAAVSFTLRQNLENLTLTGTTDLSGTGNALANVIIGNGGNNSLAGGAGADTLNGAAGRDVADYSSSTVGVTVNLALSTAQIGGDAEGDVLIRIESVNGSGTGDDVLTGNAADNDLSGNGGSDILNGGAGADSLNGGGSQDTLTGGTGNDSLTGGAGRDIFVFSSGCGADQIADFAAGPGLMDTLKLSMGTDFDSYEEIMAATTQVGADAVITMGADTITLSNVQKSSLVADDFVLLP